MSPAPQPENPLRAKALLCALRRHGSLAPTLLAHHPQSAALLAMERCGGAAQPPTINDMQWHELARLESAVGVKPGHDPRTRTGAAAGLLYFRRRYRVAFRNEWDWLLKAMPSLWRVLVGLSPQSVEEFAVLLGIEMISHAAAGRPADALGELLGPLEDRQDRLVVTRVKELEGKALPRDITAAWEESYRRAMTRRTGAKLLRSLALSLLANLQAAGLDERTRAAAARHCRSDLFHVLDLGRKSSKPLPASHLPPIESMVLDLLGRLRPAKPAELNPEKGRKK